MGYGPELHANRLAAPSSGDLIVLDERSSALVKVDRLSGNRSIVAGAGVGAGPAFEGPVDIDSVDQ